MTPPAIVAPAITQQPANVSVTAGATATFSVTASGTAPLAYQWQRNGVAIAGATGASYTLSSATLADSGASLRAIVSNSAGSATSDAAALTVTAAPTPPTASQSGPCYGAGPRGGWCMQNRDPVSIDLLGGTAPTATTAYAVGGGSVVIKTTDGGSTWQRLRQYDATTGFCRAIAAPDANTVYAGCQQGDIIKSTDAGATWIKLGSGMNTIVQDVAAHSANVVWVLGQAVGVSRTTDGTNFTKLSTITGNIQHLVSPDDNTAYVAVDLYNVARTTDGGATWTTTTIGTAGNDGEIVAMAAPSANVAWSVSAAGTVMRTTDGSTWAATTRPRSGTFLATQAGSIYAADANNAYISYAGADSSGFPTAQIYHTADGGATWTATRVDTPNRFAMTRLFSGDTGRVWGVSYAGAIFATTDQGATWSEQSKGPNLPLVNISVVDSNVAWAGGFGPTISRTVDGTHWSYVFDQENNGAFATSDRLTVAGISATTAFAAGSVGVLLKTVDGGANWSVVSNLGPDAVPSTPNVPKTITRTADGTLWMAGDSFVGRSTDSGANWTASLPPSGSNYLGKLVGINAQIAYVQYGQGGWYRTIDGGTTFQAVPTLGSYLDLVSMDASTYVAVGLHGTIARSADGGATFAAVPQTVSATFEDIQAVASGSASVVWAASSTRMLRSDDAGLTWRVQRAPTLELGLVQAMVGIDANTAWAVGYSSGIMKTTDGGD